MVSVGALSSGCVGGVGCVHAIILSQSNNNSMNREDMDSQKTTIRTVLSMATELFDPIGLVAPIFRWHELKKKCRQYTGVSHFCRPNRHNLAVVDVVVKTACDEDIYVHSSRNSSKLNSPYSRCVPSPSSRTASPRSYMCFVCRSN